MVILWLLRHKNLSDKKQYAIMAGVGVVINIPLPTLSIIQYILSLAPIFSVGSLVFSGCLLWRLFGHDKFWLSQDFKLFVGWNLVVASFLYFTVLGLVPLDLYYLGYGFSMWFIVVAIITIILLLRKNLLFYLFLGYIIAFDLGLSYSNNFFDYIIDPLLVLICFIIVGIATMKWLVNKKFMTWFECITLPIMILLVVIGYFMYIFQEKYYLRYYIIEDGLIEWLSVAALLLSAIICFWRFVKLKKFKPVLFLVCLFLGGMIFLFGAGEEISWGQRIFNYSVPEFFQNYNAQKETNIHNLIIPKEDGRIKINKIIFGVLLTIIIVTYLVVFPFIYYKYPRARKLIDSLAIPIPRPVHLVSYLLLFILIFGFFPKKSRRGELLEMGGTTIFLCIVAAPQNRNIYTIEDEESGENEESGDDPEANKEPEINKDAKTDEA